MNVNRSVTMNSEEEKVYRLEGKTMKYGTSVFSIRRNHGSRPKKRRTKRESQEADAAQYVGTTPDPAPDPIPAPDINETASDINVTAQPNVHVNVTSVSFNVKSYHN